MAIVEMKRVSILAMAADKDKLLHTMQKFGCVQVSEPEGDVEAYLGAGRAPAENTAEQLTRVQWAIGQLNRYDTQKRGMLQSLAMPTTSEASAEAVAQEAGALMGIVEETEAIERRSGDLRGQEARIRAHVERLLPWRALNVPVEQIGDTRSTLQFAGTVSNRSLQPLADALRDIPAVLEHLGDERESAFVWVLAHKSVQTRVHEALQAADFAPVSFSGDHGTVAQLLDVLRKELDGVQAERDGLEDDRRRLSAELPRLKILYEIISARAEREEAARRFAVTGSTFLMEGWVPADAAEKLEKKLRAVSEDLSIEMRDPTEAEKPPTMLRNNRAAAPFETVVTSYSYPDPRGLDPTYIMAPFFACLFGMMLSDAGYGLVMAVLIPLIIHKYKPKPGTKKLLWVLFFGGVFTVIWGTVFNTWFGTNPSFMPMIIDTLNDPIPMLMLCIGMGALHLFTGLGVAAYMNIRRGKILDMVYDQLSWAALIIGIALLLLPQAAAVGKWMAIAGALTILLFAGRDKKNIVSRLLGGGGALYGISSWLSDLLSYMRLFGMGLATGVIGLVINMLVGLMMGKNIIFTLIGIVILIGGHIFNFAINALGAYVHSCRLQYIEFFSKFYEDGGDPFRPLAQKPLYVAITDDGAES